MSVKRKEKSIFRTISIDVGITVVIFMILLVAVAWMLNAGVLESSVCYVVVAAMVFTACFVSAVILKMQQDAFLINAIGTGMILVLVLLLFFAQQGSGAQASSLVRCAGLIVAGRFIPSVIKMRKSHKMKRRSVR